MSAEYREYIDPTTATVKRRRLDLTERGLENFFVAGRDHIEDNSYIDTSKGLLSNPQQTELAKKSGPVFVKTPERQIRKDSTEEPAGTRTSEAEQTQPSIKEPLVLTEIANITEVSNSGSRERAAEETSITIITPSIVTEIPQQNPIEGQPVLRKAVEQPKEAKQQAKAAEREAVVPQVVIKQSEGNKLEQESLELAMQLAEEDRLEQLRKDELEQQSLTPAMKLEEEEARIKLEAILAKIEEDRQQLEREKAEQLRLEKEAEEREEAAEQLKLETARLKREAEERTEKLEAERLAKIEEDRLAKLEEAELLAKQQAEEREAEKPRKIEVKKKAELELLVKHLEARKLKIEKEEEKRDEAAEQLEEAIAAAKLATVKLQTARLNVNDEQTTKLEETTQVSIKEGKKLLRTGERAGLEELTEELETLTKGMSATATAYENPENRESIEKAVKPRQEREKAEQRVELLPEQQAAKLLAKQSLKEVPSEKQPSLSLFEKFRSFINKKSSANDNEIEMTQVKSLDLLDDENLEVYTVGDNFRLGDLIDSH